MEIAIGIGLGAACLLSGGGGFWYWKRHQHDLGQYDAVLHIDYNQIFNLSNTRSISDPISWKYSGSAGEAFLDQPHSAVVLSVIGDYNQGKTFVINSLANVNLESKYQGRTEGVSFKLVDIKSFKSAESVLLIDTEGSNCLPEDAMDLDLMVRKQSFDQFIQEVACRFGDLSVIVTDKPTKDLMQQIADVAGILKSSRKMKIITVVYNSKSIEKKEDLEQFFQKEVVDKFKCSKTMLSKPDIFYYYSTYVIKGDLFKIIHLPFGKNGSEAGKVFNKNSIECIKYLITDEAMRKNSCEESSTFSISNKIVELSPLFRRFLGVNVTPQGFSIA